jgi:hypothetical protein
MKYKDITPSEFQMCGGCNCGCPAVLETETSYVIIGKKLSDADFDAIKDRVADDEFVISVEKGMIDGLK